MRCVGWIPNLLDKTAARLLKKSFTMKIFVLCKHYLSEKEIESEEDEYIRQCFHKADFILSPCSNSYRKC